jgi:UDP-N-acetylglucosamine transferase subunit ALG13
MFWKRFMIFVTVGTDLPFDRMMRVIDEWARENDRRDVFAQIGEGGWEPEFLEYSHFLQPPEFKRRFNEASLIISHAGMGTILSALMYGKPILIMPKSAALGEHRNEHQLATAKRMKELGLVHFAADEIILREMLEGLDSIEPARRIATHAPATFTDQLRDFIFSENTSANKNMP